MTAKAVCGFVASRFGLSDTPHAMARLPGPRRLPAALPAEPEPDRAAVGVFQEDGALDHPRPEPRRLPRRHPNGRHGEGARQGAMIPPAMPNDDPCAATQSCSRDHQKPADRGGSRKAIDLERNRDRKRCPWRSWQHCPAKCGNRCRRILLAHDGMSACPGVRQRRWSAGCPHQWRAPTHPSAAPDRRSSGARDPWRRTAAAPAVSSARTRNCRRHRCRHAVCSRSGRRPCGPGTARPARAAWCG